MRRRVAMIVFFLFPGIWARAFCAESLVADDEGLSRAIQYSMQGDLDRAISEYDNMIFLDPKCALAYYNRAKLYENKGNFDQAILDYGKTIACDPKYELAYYYRAVIYQARGLTDEATADYNRILQITKSDRLGIHQGDRPYARFGQRPLQQGACLCGCKAVYACEF